MSQQTSAEYVVALSRELLDDIELGQLTSDKLLLKCSRLARLAGSDDIRSWIKYEMEGYNSRDSLSLTYMTKTGRWTERKENKGYWIPLSGIEAHIETNKTRLEASRISGVSGDASIGAINTLSKNQSSIVSTITKFSAIRSKVIGLLHAFVTGVYYERIFADVAESTFERYKAGVDALIAEKAGDVLIKIPSVIDRLHDGKDEDISQALTTCRRIIESFADAIYPPGSEAIEIGGQTLSVDASKHKNRLNAYIAERTDSEKRRTKLRQNLSNLYDRVCAGVHSDITGEEAFSLFLNVYLFLGEVLYLDTPTSARPTTEKQDRPAG